MGITSVASYSAPEILATLQGAIPPVRLSALYKIGLLLVAVIMILLPLIYIAMMAGVGYGVYFHAVRHAGIISNIWTKERRLSVGEFLRENAAPPSPEFSELYPAGLEFLEKSSALYFRIIGRIAVIAEKVEEAAGFPPIPVKGGQHEAQQLELKITKQ